jgi:hypothetical protein
LGTALVYRDGALGRDEQAVEVEEILASWYVSILCWASRGEEEE